MADNADDERNNDQQGRSNPRFGGASRDRSSGPRRDGGARRDDRSDRGGAARDNGSYRRNEADRPNRGFRGGDDRRGSERSGGFRGGDDRRGGERSGGFRGGDDRRGGERSGGFRGGERSGGYRGGAERRGDERSGGYRGGDRSNSFRGGDDRRGGGDRAGGSRGGEQSGEFRGGDARRGGERSSGYRGGDDGRQAYRGRDDRGGRDGGASRFGGGAGRDRRDSPRDGGGYSRSPREFERRERDDRRPNRDAPRDGAGRSFRDGGMRGDRPSWRSDREGNGPRTSRPIGDRPYGDRGDRSQSDRPSRPYGDRGDRPSRPYGDRGDRPQGDRPRYGDRGDRASRPYGDRGDRPQGDRPRYGDRGDRASRPYGDRGDRPQGDRPRFGDGTRHQGSRFGEASRDEWVDTDPFNTRSVRPRHDDPEIPESIVARDLDQGARAELKTLSKDNADWVARHLVAAAMFIDDDPELAHQHALSAGRRAGRIAVVRETLAITSYRTGDFAAALRELRTYRRISGRNDQLPMMVDCERGLGRPERALELGRSVDRAVLDTAVQVELAIAMSGARLDLGNPQAALGELEIPQLDPATAYSWSPALYSAYAATLEELGRQSEADEWWARVDAAAAALAEASDDDAWETIDVVEETIEGPGEGLDDVDTVGTVADARDADLDDGSADDVDAVGETAAGDHIDDDGGAYAIDDADPIDVDGSAAD